MTSPRIEVHGGRIRVVGGSFRKRSERWPEQGKTERKDGSGAASTLPTWSEEAER